MKQRNFGLAALASLVLLAASAAHAQVPYAAAYNNEAWRVVRGWEQRSPEAGIAWPANSNLNWQEKYSAWVRGLQKIPRIGGDGSTFEITTPYGKTLPAPVADCADTSMTLRTMFASWYGLPAMFKAGRNYYGHFGVRVGGPNVPSQPTCSAAACDFSAYDWKKKGWPRYAPLRSRSVGSGDDQPMIPGGGRSGAYYDELFLNKRVGFMLSQLLSGAGSGNLAFDTNAYNIKSTAIRAGDILLERWQMEGIGHTIVIKNAEAAPGGKVKVEIAAGWLPPRQALWEGSVDAHGSLSEDYFGGGACAEQKPDGTCKYTYAMYGGGLKRWRPAKAINGTWQLSVMDADKANGNAIAGNDWARLGARTAEFETLVYLPQPAELRDELLRLIGETRAKLMSKPSGCSGREKRESVFNDLYELMREEFNTSREQVDAQYRRTEDWVFAPLDYTKSPTCCWNSSTPAMGMAAVQAAITAAKAGAASCKNPVPFRKAGGDYTYRAAAGAAWVNYTDDERCGRAAFPEDAIAPWTVTDYCSLKLWTRE